MPFVFGHQFGFLRILTLLLLLLTPAVGGSINSHGRQKGQADTALNERISEGLALQGRLWLRGVLASPKDPSGGLISLRLSDNSKELHFRRGVLAMSRAGDSLWVLRQPSLAVREFVLSVWKQDRFEDVEKFNAGKDDEPFVLLNADSKLMALSSRTVRIFFQDTHRWETLLLKGELRGGLQETSAVTSSGDAIYIGFNTGEWGGGLQRVDIRTGQVTEVERRDTKEICAGPLNKDCDPVTAVIPDPREADCVFAAVGLVHMLSHGRILRVCRKEINVFFEKAEKIPFGETQTNMTQPFFGLAAAADGSLWAVSPESLYRLGADGSEKENHALPKPSTVSGIHLSRELPGVIVVWTDANWAVSVSGFTPLLIPLEDEGSLPTPSRNGLACGTESLR